jgi:hypothetical protein
MASHNLAVDRVSASSCKPADWMLTPNWGVFVDGKKIIYSTDASGIS